MVLTPDVDQETTFNAALPYAMGSIVIAGAGAVVLLTSTATSALAVITGIALTAIGTYAFLGTVLIGIFHSRDPQEFQENIGKMLRIILR